VTEPMYRQIADDLQRHIESGDLAPGEQIKTEVELREEFGQDGPVSRNTVRDAIKLLVSRGLIETRPGQGTFVVQKIIPFVTTFEGGKLEQPNRKPQLTEPRVEIQQADQTLAEQLQLGSGATVISRHQERRIDGTPWSLQTTFYPMDYVTRGATRLIEPADIPESVVTYLHEKLGIAEVGTRDMITARPPDRNEAAFFGLPDDGRVAVQEVSRAGFDEYGRPTRLTITIYPADRNRLVYVEGRLPQAGATAPNPSGAREHSGTGERADNPAQHDAPVKDDPG
jgi:GntR family transcriptional regulator